MQYFSHTLDFTIEEPSVITLGKFDGLHRGHELLIQTMREQSRARNLKTVVFTFDIPPRASVENVDVRVITTNPEKHQILDAIGLDYLVECPFTPEVRSMEPKRFITWMVEKLSVRCFVVGKDFCFGRNRSGNYKTLETYAKELGYEVIVLDKMMEDGRDISSTFVREEIAAGHMAKANHLLGYPYFIEGVIVHGNQLGRTIGIPTINIMMPHDKVYPLFGVYASMVTIDNKKYYGVTNVGKKPTISDYNPIGIETYLIDFEEDVYGKSAKVEFMDFLRAEQRFDSVPDLQEQMKKDIEKTREYYRNVTNLC